MRVLLSGRTASGRVLPSQESIHKAAHVHQVGDAPEDAR
jgi:hypothetical protein